MAEFPRTEVINPTARSQQEISLSSGSMLNASYLMALDFKKRTKLFPRPFFGLSLCSAVATSCSRCTAQQPALMAAHLLDEPQHRNTENQADHEKKNIFFSFPATD